MGRRWKRVTEYLDRRGLCYSAPSLYNTIIVLSGLYIVYWYSSTSILNQFYGSGSAIDSLVYSAVFWHSGWDLYVPNFYVDGSFFRLHLSWIIWLPSLLSYYIPLDRIPYTAAWVGLLQAALALVFMGCMHLYWPARQLYAVIVKSAAGLLFALSPIGQSVLSQSHIEIAGVLFSLEFLILLIKRRLLLATLCFVLNMAVREDMGFHLFGLMFLVLALDMTRKSVIAERKTWALYAGIGFVYSVCAMLFMHYSIKEFGNLNLVYLGNKPYAHLTQELISARIAYFFRIAIISGFL